MITDEDVQKILTAFLPVFATKQDLKEMEDGSVTKEEFHYVFDRAFGQMDQIVGEIQTIRQG